MVDKFNFAKKMAADKALKVGLDYALKDPAKNLPKLVDLAQKITRSEKYQAGLESFARTIEKNPTIIDYAQRFQELAPVYQENLITLFFVNATLLGTPYRQQKGEELGSNIPYTILLDPTSACNLDCQGCWAGKYEKSNQLDYATVDRIITEAKELGIHFFVLSGGEPTVYPHLFDIFADHQDCAFMMYTNGINIDEEMADKMLEVGNVSPCISIEGFSGETDDRRGSGITEKITRAMDILQEKGVLFGSSITVTRDNWDIFKDDDIVQELIDRGVFYTWLFHYIPIGSDPDMESMLTPKQRKIMAQRIPELRQNYPLFLIDFWNDGHMTGGCIAGGERYFHINASGDVEPCAFVHFAVDNIKDKPLIEVLRNPFFQEYQQRIPFSDNLYRPCPIIDVPEQLKKMVEATEARPTHPGADDLFSPDIANKLKDQANKWDRLSRPLHYQKLCQKGVIAKDFDYEACQEEELLEETKS